jgi:tRNA (adenine22-N1)-methyltransferase
VAFGILARVISLSDRLKLIFDQLLPGKPVWDLCCDHGYFGLHAYESQKFSEVFFVDQVPEIIERLKKHFNEKYLASNNLTETNFKVASAENLNISLTGNVVISGVGSYTISQILKSLHTKGLLKADRLILCPQNDVVKIEDLKKLPDFSYQQVHETLSVREKNRVRKIYILDLESTHT